MRPQRAHERSVKPNTAHLLKHTMLIMRPGEDITLCNRPPSRPVKAESKTNAVKYEEILEESPVLYVRGLQNIVFSSNTKATATQECL